MWEMITSLVNVTLIEPCFFEALALVYVLNPVTELTWKNVGLYLLKSVIVFVVYLLLLVFFLVLFNWFELDFGILFVYLSAIFVYVLATVILGRGQGNAKIKFTMIASFAAANIMMEAGLSFVGQLLESGTGLVWPGYVVSLVLKPAFYILDAFLVHKFTMEKFDILPKSGMIVFWVLNCLFIVFIIFFNSRNNLTDYVAISLTNILFYVFTLLLYAMMYIMCLHFTHMLQASVEAQTMEAQNAELKIRETSAEEIRRIRHDIKNQYTYMDVLMTEGRLDDLQRYFEGMKSNLKEADQYIDTGNKEVNSMLNMEQQKAREAGFELDTDILVPHVLGLDELDLSVLMINLIDNAIESNTRYSITEAVKVEMNVSNDFLYVRVGNRVPSDADSRRMLSMETSKKNRAEHGIGHRIVDKICAKHDGVCERRIDGDMFWAEAVVQLDDANPGENT